jgi:hypothetical protein
MFNVVDRNLPMIPIFIENPDHILLWCEQFFLQSEREMSDHRDHRMFSSLYYRTIMANRRSDLFIKISACFGGFSRELMIFGQFSRKLDNPGECELAVWRATAYFLKIAALLARHFKNAAQILRKQFPASLAEMHMCDVLMIDDYRNCGVIDPYIWITTMMCKIFFGNTLRVPFSIHGSMMSPTPIHTKILERFADTILRDPFLDNVIKIQRWFRRIYSRRHPKITVIIEYVSVSVAKTWKDVESISTMLASMEKYSSSRVRVSCEKFSQKKTVARSTMDIYSVDIVKTIAHKIVEHTTTTVHRVETFSESVKLSHPTTTVVDVPQTDDNGDGEELKPQPQRMPAYLKEFEVQRQSMVAFHMSEIEKANHQIAFMNQEYARLAQIIHHHSSHIAYINSLKP